MKKNIVLIFADQWRGDCLGAAGHPDIITPNADALAEESMLFDRAYAQAPSCIPARACLATGKSPCSTGFVGYCDGVVWDYPQTMMSVLRDNGYQTMQIGKTHFYPSHAHLGFEINDVYDTGKIDPGFVSDYHRWLNKETGGRVKDTASIADSNACIYHNWEAAEYLHPTAWTTDRAIERLETRDFTRPFFIQLGYHRPHPPFDPPRAFYDLYRDTELSGIPCGDWAEEYAVPTRSINAWMGSRDAGTLDRMRKAYYASITHVDYSIGRLITWLKQHRLYDDTLIVLASDHGELLGDHYMYRKISPFEGSAKILCSIKPPQSALHNAHCDTPVSHYDLMPTFLDCAGIEIPAGVEGKSLLPLLEGRDIDREKLHGEHCGYGNNGWQFLVDKRYKYIWNTMTGKEYLFDLVKDPQELHNAAADAEYEALLLENRAELTEILSCRPEDELVKDGKLSPGKILDAVRQDFRENSLRRKKEYGIL